MWFKRTILLSYTALLVTPTNAAFRTQVENLVYSEQKRSPALEQPVILHPFRRAEAWNNATNSAPGRQESESAIPDPAATPIVVTTDDASSTSAAQPRATPSERESSSAVVTEEPRTSPLPSTTTITTPPPRSIQEPVKSSSVTPTPSTTSEAEQPSSSSLAPSTLTPTPSPSLTTERETPSSESIESSASSTTPLPSSAQASSSVATLTDDQVESTSVKVLESNASASSTITGTIDNGPTSTTPASSTSEVSPPPISTADESKSLQVPENTPSPSITSSDVVQTTETPAPTPPSSSAAESNSDGIPENTPSPSTTTSNLAQPPETPAPTPPSSSAAESNSDGAPENSPSTTSSDVGPIGDQSTTTNVDSPVITNPPVISSAAESFVVSTQEPDIPSESSVTSSPTKQPDATITPSGIFHFPSDISSLVSNIASDIVSDVSSLLDVSTTAPPVVVPTESLGDQLSSIFSEIENGASSIDAGISSLTSGILIPSSSVQTTGLPIPTSEGDALISSTTNDMPQFTLSLSQSTTDTSGISFSASGTGASVISEASITGPAVSKVSSFTTGSLAFETTTNSPVPGLSTTETTDASSQPTPSVSEASGQRTGQDATTTPITDLPSTTPATTLLPSPGSSTLSGSTNASLASSSFDITSASVAINTLSSISASVSDTVIDTQETSAIPSNSGSSTVDSSLPTATSASNSEVTRSGFASSTGSDVATSTGTSVDPSNASTASRADSSASAFNGKSTESSGASTQATASAAASGSASKSLTLQATMTMPSGFLLSTTGYTASVTTPAPATSSTKAAGSGDDAKPAPLTKSQTAGIAIGGTTCLLIALVAAVFLARRSLTSSNRNSVGGVYPEVAYLYDPPTSGNDDAEAGGGVLTMSGGATGYGAVPVSSPRNSISSGASPFRDPIIPSPSPSPRLNGYGGPIGDHRGQYAKLEVNPYAFNSVFSEFPPLSPYGARSTQNLLPTPAGRGPETRYSGPYADTPEHDLLLNVRSETPDSYIMLAAPPPTPRTGGRLTPETGRYTPDNFSLARTTPELISVRSLAPSSQTNLSMRGAITPPQRAASPPPVHKGWDDIKFDIDGYDMTPSQRGVSPQKGWANIRLDVEEPVPMPEPLTLAPAPKKNLPQRRQPPLAGAGQLLLSGQGLPLTVKPAQARPGTPGSAKIDRGLGLEVPNMTAVYGSPGPMVDEYSQDPAVRKKRSGELIFADPHLIGKSF